MKKFDIIFCLPELNASPSATAQLVLRLARQLAGEGIRAAVLGVTNEIDAAVESEEGGLTLIKAPTFSGISSLKTDFESAVRRKSNGRAPLAPLLRRALSHPLKTLKLWAGCYRPRHRFQERAMLRALRPLLPDCGALAGVILPFSACAAALSLKGAHKRIVYQVDPYAFNESLPAEQRARRVSQELRLFRGADAAITTPELYAQYSAWPEYKEVLPKLYACGFPCLAKPASPDRQRFIIEDGKINLVYCGVMNDAYRPARFALELLERAAASSAPLKVYFAGRNESEALASALVRSPALFEHLGELDGEQARELCASADFLLDIGNKAGNQVPSKLFAYFSTGLPVVSFQTREDSPGLP
ncbi:MAG: hypothetical protein Q4B42_02895, partial [Oscillospiraceae bacterium]|nr:hypothetical protein [Oscillospiraceae bacterium]